MIIDQQTDLYGVVGYPLSHTLSPTMHNAAFSASGLNAVYLAFETEDIAGCLRGMRALGIEGMSVTIPFKSSVIPLLDDLEESAKSMGAVNTIVSRRARLKGYNTDAPGALKALEAETGLSDKRCLVIGAGGAARAIGCVLRGRCAHLTIANRSIERGQTLSDYLGCRFVPLDAVEGLQADLLIHATSVGMYPRDEQCLIPPKALKAGMVVMDVVYHPLETRLLREARQRGCQTISGLAMFIHQGAEQYRLWTGIDPPVDAMARAVKEALKT
jgi:shikimate dehydrogenase